REEIEQEQLEARREEIQRFLAGEGLSMAYQPIVNLEDHDVIGVEALARFRSFPMPRPDERIAEARALDLGVHLALPAIPPARGGGGGGGGGRGRGRTPQAPPTLLPVGELLPPGRAVRGPGADPRADGGADGRRDHGARGGRRLRRARTVAGSAPPDGRADRD